MKKLNKILAALLAVLMVAFLPGIGSVKVKAETTHYTYTAKWISSMNEWRTQRLSSWDDSRENGNLDYIWNNIQDGDSLVIVGDSGAPRFEDLHLNRKLANLTLYAVTSGIIVYADQPVTDIYVLKGSEASLHGSYTNVYVYDNSACNINNNVQYLYVGGESSMNMNVTAVGTVGHCKIENKGTLVKEIYNVSANSLKIVNGEDKTDASTYSTTATATTATTATTTTTTTTTTTGTAATGTGVSPKTGEGYLMILLFAGAVLCFAGFRYARRKAA